jgi:hypothetical protein
MKRLTNLTLLALFVVLQVAGLASAGDLVQSPLVDTKRSRLTGSPLTARP